MGVGSAALSWGYARRVAGATSGQAQALAIALKRVPEAERLAALEKRAPAGSWERAAAAEALAAADARGQVAAWNDAIGELEHTLGRGATWPGAAIRIAAFGGMLLAIAAFLAAREIQPALIILGIAGASALASIEARRRGKRAAAEQRAAVDALVAVVTGHLDAGPPAPERRSRRRGAGR
jgi:hypothetical protein